MKRSDWPQEIPTKPSWTPHLKRGPLASFDARVKVKADKRAAREGNSLAHLAMVRQLWCSLGNREDRREVVHPHHLQGGPCRKLRGLGRRSPDCWAVPLVWWRHEELHALGSRHEREYFMDHSGGLLDPYALAIALWAISPHLELAARILDAHQRHATRRLLGLSHATLGRAVS